MLAPGPTYKCLTATFESKSWLEENLANALGGERTVKIDIGQCLRVSLFESRLSNTGDLLEQKALEAGSQQAGFQPVFTSYGDLGEPPTFHVPKERNPILLNYVEK